MSIACALTACSTDDATDSMMNQSTINSNADRLVYAEALAKAKASVGEMSDSVSRTIDLSNGVKAITQDKDTLMYVFNFKDNKGYSIISASKKTPNFKIISEKGSFDPENVQDSAITRCTKELFAKSIVPQTRFGETRYEEVSSTVRYCYEETLYPAKNISKDQVKKDVFENYVGKNQWYQALTAPASFTPSGISSALNESNKILFFRKSGSPCYVTEYGTSITIMYWEVKYSPNSYWTRGGKCTQFTKNYIKYSYGSNGKIYTNNGGYIDDSDISDVKLMYTGKVLNTGLYNSNKISNSGISFDISVTDTYKKARLEIRRTDTGSIYKNIDLAVKSGFGYHSHHSYFLPKGNYVIILWATDKNNSEHSYGATYTYSY